MSFLRRLDHVAVLIRDTENALTFYRDRLGLTVHSTQELPDQHVRLTYLDAGNAYIQLVEPLDAASPLMSWLAEHGEGLHHICFGVDNVSEAVAALSDDGAPVALGTGRGRVSGFVTTDDGHGVRIECTEFQHSLDVDESFGYIPSRVR